MKKLASMYSFSSKLWYDKRWISKSGEASVYLQVTLDGKHDEFPLKLRWPVNKIDLVNSLLLPRRRRDDEVSDYNLIIMVEQAKHTEILRTYRLKNAPIDLKQFSKEVRVFDKKESFVSFMRRDSLTRYTLKEIDKRTWQNANAAIEQMIYFDAVWLFDQLTVNWMKRFKLKLINDGFEPGGIWSVIKNVKTYLQRAKKEPLLHVDQAVSDFSNPEPKWKTNFCNRDEVNQLILLYKKQELAANHQEVLKAFLFTCFTSLRISDVYRVNGKWRMNPGFLDFIPKKNEKKKKWLHIPIMPQAYAFVKNSAGKFFDLPSEREYNEILKQIAAAADIRKPLTSHYGRHTFGHIYMVTIGNLKGLQEILGHSKIETTMRYAHLDDDYKTETVNRMQAEFPALLELKSRG
jgi:integrase/recombinase XerD